MPSRRREIVSQPTNSNAAQSSAESDIIRRLADGEDPWTVDPDHGCSNPLTGYFPASEVAAELARQSSRREVEKIAEPRHRYYAICWRDDCPGSLDTYGGDDILEIVREHVAEHGCEVRVRVESYIEIRPKGQGA
jgi:hypothetical protein